ncbi:TIM barrel protein [Mycolicibacterium sp. A43C]
MTPGTAIACTVRPWAQFPLERALAAIADAGYRAVALPVHGVTEVITARTSAVAAAEIGAMIAGQGLDLVVLSHAADLDRTDRDALHTLRSQLDHCARLGVLTLVDMGCPDLDQADRYLRLMAAAAPYAETLGVTIAVKPHGGLTRTAADTLSLVHRIGHPAFRVCWDPGNLVHYGDEPFNRGLAELAPFVAAVGVRDHPARRSRRVGSADMPPAITPGDGMVDFTELYRHLYAHGFRGPSAVESVTKLGTVEELTTEARRALHVVSDAMSGRTPHHPPPAPRITAWRSCSHTAQRESQDPIGTAKSFDRYLMLELALPWPPGMGTPVWETDRVSIGLRRALRAATARMHERGLTMKTFAAAPDPEYSVTSMMRIIRFDRPHPSAARLHRNEYLVPTEIAPEVIDALFPQDLENEPVSLASFAEYRDDTDYRDLAVCTHGSVDACCGTRGYPFYRQLREDFAETPGLRVWRISSFGGHRFAPTLADLPDGRFWGNLSADRMPALIQRNGHPAELMDLYRGWACLPSAAEQVIERELLLSYGWEWRHRELTIDRIDVDRYLLHIRDLRSGALQHRIADVGELGVEPVLVGCDRTVGEISRYSATLQAATFTPTRWCPAACS